MITVYGAEPGARPVVPEDLTDDVATAVRALVMWEASFREKNPCGLWDSTMLAMRLAIDMTAWQMHFHQVYAEVPRPFTEELAALTAQDLLAVIRSDEPSEPLPAYHFGVAVLSEGVDVHEPCETYEQARALIEAGKGCYTRDVMAVLADGTKVNIRYHGATDVITLVLAEPEELTADPYEDLVVELNELLAQLHQQAETEAGSGSGENASPGDVVDVGSA